MDGLQKKRSEDTAERGLIMEKGGKWKRAEVICIMIVLVLLALLAKAFYQPETMDERSAVYSLGSGWYQLRDGERINLQLPGTVMADTDGKVMLYNDTLSALDVGMVISTRGVEHHLEICMGDQVLYQYRNQKFQKNLQMQGKIWADVFLPKETGQEPVCLIYEGKKNGQLYIQAPIIGSFAAVIRNHVKEAFFSVLIMLGMLGLGVASVIVYLYIRHRQIEEKRFLNVAYFLILCDFWCILDSGMYQMYGSQTAAGTLISFYAFMLMSVPMLRFVQNTVRKNVRWVPEIWVFLLYGNAILQGILHVVFAIPFIHMLFITHLVLFTGVVAMLLLLWKEYQRKREQELELCLKAFGVLGISGLLALVLYWIFSIYWYDAVFRFGILLFIAILFGGLLNKVSGDIQFRLEQAVYERMSLEDRMTGLKNRKAFEKRLEEIQEEAILLENALLLFVDMKGLKNINNRYGMQVGDEAVIRTARCLRTAGDIAGQEADCYRTEGNEFAVIITNPQIQPQEWETSVKNEMKKEPESRYRVRLRFGYSYLRKEDGVLQSVSDWKAQADRMLHEII